MFVSRIFRISCLVLQISGRRTVNWLCFLVSAKSQTKPDSRNHFIPKSLRQITHFNIGFVFNFSCHGVVLRSRVFFKPRITQINVDSKNLF